MNGMTKEVIQAFIFGVKTQSVNESNTDINILIVEYHRSATGKELLHMFWSTMYRGNLTYGGIEPKAIKIIRYIEKGNILMIKRGELRLRIYALKDLRNV